MLNVYSLSVAVLYRVACVSVGMQIPFELGIAIKRPQGYFVLVRTIIEVIRHIRETNICALVVSVISIAFLITIKVTDCTVNTCVYTGWAKLSDTTLHFCL